MPLAPHELTRRRMLLNTVLRCFAGLLFCYAAFTLLGVAYTLVWYATDSPSTNEPFVGRPYRYALLTALFYALGPLLGAMFLLFTQHSVVGWLCPAPRAVCPTCASPLYFSPRGLCFACAAPLPPNSDPFSASGPGAPAKHG